MCTETVAADGFEATTRNGSTVVIQKVPGSKRKLLATVTKSTDTKHPVGKQVVYQTEMGHVRCSGGGPDDEKCRLHALDAVGIGNYLGNTRVEREVNEATGKKGKKTKAKAVEKGDTVPLIDGHTYRLRNGDTGVAKKMDDSGEPFQIDGIWYLRDGQSNLAGHDKSWDAVEDLSAKKVSEGFKKGDTVIVKRPRTAKGRDASPTWVDDMDIFDGVEAKVVKEREGFSGKVVELSGHKGIRGYLFSPKWLKATVLTDSDLVPA